MNRKKPITRVCIIASSILFGNAYSAEEVQLPKKIIEWQKATQKIQNNIIDILHPSINKPNEGDVIQNSDDIRAALQASCKLNPKCPDSELAYLDKDNPKQREPEKETIESFRAARDILEKKGMGVISSPLSPHFDLDPRDK